MPTKLKPRDGLAKGSMKKGCYPSVSIWFSDRDCDSGRARHLSPGKCHTFVTIEPSKQVKTGEIR